MKKEQSKKRVYRKYDAAFKSDAVSQLLGVSVSLLYKWKQESTGGRNREQSEEITLTGN